MCASVHGAFDQLELVDAALDRPGAPGQGQRGAHGIDIAPEPPSEGSERAFHGGGQPLIEGASIAIDEHRMEATGEVGCDSQGRGRRAQRSDEGTVIG